MTHPQATAQTRETDPAALYLASKYGQNFRAILGLGEPGSQPYAEQDDSVFWGYFGDLHGDPAPDLTAHSRATWGMS